MQSPLPDSAKIPHAALPQNHRDLCQWLRLCRSRRVGPMTFIRLIREHGDATAALEALPEVASKSGVKAYTPYSIEAAEKEIQQGYTLGAQLLCLGADNYPAMLATIPDPPPLLWALGNSDQAQRPCVALVGARNASSLGRRMAARLSRDLSEAGYIVVSGLARGIDTEAHYGALQNGTVAVQAGGIDNVYPKENITLAEKITTGGLLLAEMPVGVQPQARHFPRRNRIISGLAQAVVVIEGAGRSGSLITAKDALDQGREVMAVPGNPMDGRAAGCNMLIRDGATLVRSAQDIIEVLIRNEDQNIPSPPSQPSEPEGNLPNTILSLLGPTPVSEDIIIRQSRWSPRMVLSALTYLEVTKKVERMSGGVTATPTAA